MIQSYLECVNKIKFLRALIDNKPKYEVEKYNECNTLNVFQLKTIKMFYCYIYLQCILSYVNLLRNKFIAVIIIIILHYFHWISTIPLFMPSKFKIFLKNLVTIIRTILGSNLKKEFLIY